MGTGNKKSVYTKEDKAIYKLAMANRLLMEESSEETIDGKSMIIIVKETIAKLKAIANKLNKSSEFSDIMHAIDVELEISLQGLQARYEREKIIYNKKLLIKSRNEDISKLAYINQLCNEAEEKYERGKIKFSHSDFETAFSCFRDAIDYYNKSQHLLNQIKNTGEHFSSHTSTIAKLGEIKILLKPICSSNPLSNNTIYLKTDNELKSSLFFTKTETIAEEQGPTPTFDKDIFVNTIGVVTYNKQTISTNFTDEQAVTICSKMSDSYARNVAAKYCQLSKHIQGSIHRYQLHYLANKSLTFYGGPVLTFLLGLRALKFNSHSAYVVNFQKPSIDVTDINVDFPALTFTTLKGDKYTLAFHLTQGFSGHENKKPVRIFKKSVQVGFIDNKGYILDTKGDSIKKLSYADSTLLTFCCFLANSKSPAFYSGVETGNCFICNRQLTDPISIRYGIGPICLGKAIN